MNGGEDRLLKKSTLLGAGSVALVAVALATAKVVESPAPAQASLRAGATVISALSLRKLFSPMPFTPGRPSDGSPRRMQPPS